MNLRAITYRTMYGLYFRFNGFGSPQIYKFTEKSQWLPSVKIQEYQDKKLQRLIEYVYKDVVYYRRVMDEYGIKPKDIKTTDDLIKLPVLTKEQFRKNWNELISVQASSLKTYFRQTGGTTGEPLRFINEYSSNACEIAAIRRGFGFAGYKLGEPMIELFGGSLGLVQKSFVEKVTTQFSGVVRLPAFEIGQDTLGKYIKKIRQSKAKYLRGYASAIYLLAKLMEDARLSIPLKAVFPTAENLFDFQRQTIEKVFQCKVFNQYGCGECNSIANECSSHDGLHIADEYVFLESLKGKERVLDGEMGALTLTRMNNFAMPLIRYQNGDVVSLDRTPCSCGRGLSRIANIYGRTNDLLLAKDGRLVSATFMPSFCVNVHMKGVQQFQVIQEERDTIHLKIVKSPEFEESEIRPLIEVLHRYLGDVKIKVEYVTSIPKTPQNKLKFVISKFGDKILG